MNTIIFIEKILNFENRVVSFAEEFIFFTRN